MLRIAEQRRREAGIEALGKNLICKGCWSAKPADIRCETCGCAAHYQCLDARDQCRTCAEAPDGSQPLHRRFWGERIQQQYPEPRLPLTGNDISGAMTVSLGVTPLGNLGNTCFIAAPIQILLRMAGVWRALLCCDAYVPGLLQLRHHMMNGASDEASRAFAVFVSIVRQERWQLNSENGEWSSGDAQIFLRRFFIYLDLMSEGKLREAVEICVEETHHCSNGDCNVAQTPTSASVPCVPLEGNLDASLIDRIGQYFDERLSSHCARCGSAMQRTRRFTRAPQHLILTVQYWEPASTNPPRQLICPGGGKTKFEYNLVGAVVYREGHFVAVVLDDEGVFWALDEQIRRVETASDWQSSYILFYNKSGARQGEQTDSERQDSGDKHAGTVMGSRVGSPELECEAAGGETGAEGSGQGTGVSQWTQGVRTGPAPAREVSAGLCDSHLVRGGDLWLTEEPSLSQGRACDLCGSRDLDDGPGRMTACVGHCGGKGTCAVHVDCVFERGTPQWRAAMGTAPVGCQENSIHCNSTVVTTTLRWYFGGARTDGRTLPWRVKCAYCNEWTNRNLCRCGWTTDFVLKLQPTIDDFRRGIVNNMTPHSFCKQCGAWTPKKLWTPLTTIAAWQVISCRGPTPLLTDAVLQLVLSFFCLVRGHRRQGTKYSTSCSAFSQPYLQPPSPIDPQQTSALGAWAIRTGYGTKKKLPARERAIFHLLTRMYQDVPQVRSPPIPCFGDKVCPLVADFYKALQHYREETLTGGHDFFKDMRDHDFFEDMQRRLELSRAAPPLPPLAPLEGGKGEGGGGAGGSYSYSADAMVGPSAPDVETEWREAMMGPRAPDAETACSDASVTTLARVLEKLSLDKAGLITCTYLIRLECGHCGRVWFECRPEVIHCDTPSTQKARRQKLRLPTAGKSFSACCPDCGEQTVSQTSLVPLRERPMYQWMQAKDGLTVQADQLITDMHNSCQICYRLLGSMAVDGDQATVRVCLQNNGWAVISCTPDSDQITVREGEPSLHSAGCVYLYGRVRNQGAHALRVGTHEPCLYCEVLECRNQYQPEAVTVRAASWLPQSATTTNGLGLFSTCPISAGAYVAEFGGLHEVTSSTKGERIHVRLVGGGTTFMGWKNAPTLSLTSDKLGQYVNSTCCRKHCNALLVHNGRTGKKARVWIQLQRDVLAHREILVNYGSGFWTGVQSCLCCRCRGVCNSTT